MQTKNTRPLAPENLINQSNFFNTTNVHQLSIMRSTGRENKRFTQSKVYTRIYHTENQGRLRLKNKVSHKKNPSPRS